jgi:undecaprenyl-diphosphatase
LDWTIFHALNSQLAHQEGGQDAAQSFNAAAIFVLVALAGSIWFFGRPGGANRSKLAAVSAATAGALALLINIVLGALWFHDRPFVDHPRQTLLLVHHAADNSFPSDHASLAFAIAFAIVAFHRRLGLLLVLGAICIGVDRIFIGVHYPIDVLASLFVGLGAAVIVTTIGRPSVTWTVEQLSRLSDPVVAAAVAFIATRGRRRTM